MLTVIVDGAIHAAAGRGLLEECTLVAPCEVGDAKVTTGIIRIQELNSGHKLPAKFVVHTVGPIGENKPKLESCYKRCLEVSVKYRIKTLVCYFCCFLAKYLGFLWNINWNLWISIEKSLWSCFDDCKKMA